MFTRASSSFQYSLKTSGYRGYEFLELWNLVPFLPDIGFQLLKSSCSSLTYFLFNDAPNVVYIILCIMTKIVCGILQFIW